MADACYTKVKTKCGRKEQRLLSLEELFGPALKVAVITPQCKIRLST